MKALIGKTKKEQEAALDRTIRKHIVENMADYECDFCAQWLCVLAETFGFRKVRLERAYREFYKRHRAEKIFYEDFAFEGVVESEAKKELRELGIDINEWHRDFSDPMVSYEFTRGIKEAKRRRDGK